MSPTQVFSYEFWVISKNTFFLEHLRASAYENWAYQNPSSNKLVVDATVNSCSIPKSAYK